MGSEWPRGQWEGRWGARDGGGGGGGGVTSEEIVAQDDFQEDPSDHPLPIYVPSLA